MLFGMMAEKTLTALSGLFLLLFLGSHLLGVGQILGGVAAVDAYARHLHEQPWLPLAELLIAAGFLTHFGLVLHRSWANARARGPLGYRRSASKLGRPLATLASGSSLVTGLGLAIFLVIHLGDFRLQRATMPSDGTAMLTLFQQPDRVLLYALAGLLVGLHLLHGVESASRSLGLHRPERAQLIRRGGQAIAATLGLGFAGLSLWLGGQAG